MWAVGALDGRTRVRSRPDECVRRETATTGRRLAARAGSIRSRSYSTDRTRVCAQRALGADFCKLLEQAVDIFFYFIRW